MVKISVIIPAHRLDMWLDEAVNSVLVSTDSEINVVVVVNGTDDVPVNAWSSDPRVKILHDRSALGPTRAMLLGLSAADGEYVARLDADDRMHPNRLHLQSEYLDAHPGTPLVGTLVRRITATGEDAGVVKMPAGDDVRRNLLLSNVVPHSSVLMRRSTLDDIGSYDQDLMQMEDYDVILRLGCEGPIAILPEVLTDYRLHGNQISRGAQPRGEHINAVIRGRKNLARTLRVHPLQTLAQNFLWRTVQFTRYYRVTKPGHEY